jgi:hypothetical protein
MPQEEPQSERMEVEEGPLESKPLAPLLPPRDQPRDQP